MLNKNIHSYQILYENALYRIPNLPDVLIQPGSKSPSIDQLFDEYKVECAAIITPYNPKSMQLCGVENEERMHKFKKQLSKLALPYFDTISSDKQGGWLEAGTLVMGIDLKSSKQLGREYGQNAIIYLESKCAPKVIWLQ